MFVVRARRFCISAMIMGKNKMGTEADLIKQCWAEAEAAEKGKIISTKRYRIIGEPP